MQSVGGWPAKGPVRSPGLRVTVGGVVRDVVSASARASVGVSDVAARTGDVVWAPRDVVSRRQDSVLSAGVPRRGDRVSVGMGEGSALASVLTGKVETTTVAVPGVLASDLVDDYDLLSTRVDLPSLMASMPPSTDEEPLIRVGLTATWPTQRALSLAGFYATPPARTGAYVSASLNGSLWPEFGTIRSSPTMPTWSPAPWGQAASNFTALFTGVAGSMTSRPLEVSFLVSDGAASGNTFVYVRFADGSIRLTADGNRAVRAEMIVGGTTTAVASLSSAEMAGAELARLRVSVDGSWVLSNGAVTKTVAQAVPAGLRGVPQDVYVSSPADGRPIAGLNVGYYTTTPAEWRRTAIIDAPDGTLAASRAVVSTPARDVLQERAKAEYARMWISADGVFVWRSRGRWGSGSPVATLNDVDLLGYSMGMDYDSVYSGAVVSCKAARTEVRGMATITLHQGARQVLNAGNVQHDFIEVPSDEDWPEIDESMDVLASEGWTPAFNRGRRSWSGAVRVSADGEKDFWATGPASGEYATVSFEKIDARKWLHTLTVSSSLPADQTVETRTVRPDKIPLGTGLWSQWAEEPMPLVRGYARVMWTDEKRYGSTSTTIVLPPLEHDCSWWVQGAAVQRLADDLASRFAAPVLTIQDLRIVPDARIEIGDVLTLNDSTYAGLTARVVVTGVTLSVENGSMSMSLDVEVLSGSATTDTYRDVQDTASASTYAQFQALIGAITYSEQEAL